MAYDTNRPSPPAEGIPDRLYGRRRGHPLRPRQQRLLDLTLPRITLAPPESPRAGFPMEAESLWLEVGFGGGEHALELARANPRVALIASEVFENGLCSLLTHLVPEEQEATAPLPPNLRLWPKDARHLLQALPDASLDRLFLMFPDPWPKARHAKRRFVHPALLPLLAAKLKPGAEWRIASDDPTYQAWVDEVMGAQDLFGLSAHHDAPPADWPRTRYEAKALREGRHPRYWIWRRR
ncbi:tRNA (guanosine(46)-N7)-methyltransferase TrmB [Roseomonas sp. SSH11]|uniref:tRNA (guanine-N(7)-)-methyltransferase n=1 Tax=Pararoseomonas baculiformis TaxID=2820812 RepID=A0ABS4AH84_9PROT|nr:tRNA (guanine(46)-N(7))-methyltransferase TrmB [Pararoseomonas baculiformis]MBP0446385.1 tRNA (guanosine(46)-N7)-methyltransferase TrmB [Pararoseomonas baculiformis]